MALDQTLSAWLSTNRDDYEFYLLHLLFHDAGARSSKMLALEPYDFGRDENVLIYAALQSAIAFHTRIGVVYPAPPSIASFNTFIAMANKTEGMDDATVLVAQQKLQHLIDPAHREHWHVIDPLFVTWYSSVRGKQAARRIQMSAVADVALEVTHLQRDIARGAAAVYNQEEDDMHQAIHSKSEEAKVRRSTGIRGLDICLNGGFSNGDCYGLFSGTGGGKSIVAGQVSIFEAEMGGWPLVVSTELKVPKYIVRMVANAASIPIPLIQDCMNFHQIRMMVSMDQKYRDRIDRVEKVLELIAQRVAIRKVHPDEGLSSRSLLDREYDLYARKYGHPPTLVVLDWLGSMADVNTTGKSSDRTLAWEVSANGCVNFADVKDVATLVLLQAVNDAQLKTYLTQSDVGISKGVLKNMVAGIGLTNTIDKAGIQAAIASGSDLPTKQFLDDQSLCLAKAREGEGTVIPITRQFLYQRIVQRNRSQS